MDRRLLVRLLGAVLTVTVALASAACAGSDDSSDTPVVATSTDVWGSIAEAVAGSDAKVESVIKDPTADPHSYESSPSDAAAITDADLVVYNGGGYDPFVEKVLGGSEDRKVVDAYSLRTDKSDENEHVWYDIATVDAVAHKIADELTALDPGHRSDYARRADDFGNELRQISDVTARIAADHPKSPVAQTEPIAHYLLVAADADDVTPAEFQDAVEAGNDPPPAAVAATRDLMSGRKVRALVYNIQTEDKVTKEIRTAAESSGVRIVEVTETLPSGQGYIDWQMHNAQALAAALS